MKLYPAKPGSVIFDPNDPSGETFSIPLDPARLITAAQARVAGNRRLAIMPSGARLHRRDVETLRRVHPSLFYASCGIPQAFPGRVQFFTQGLGQGVPGLNGVSADESHTNMRVSGGQMVMNQSYLANAWTVLVGAMPTDELLNLLASTGISFQSSTTEIIWGSALAGYFDFVRMNPPLDLQPGFDFRVNLSCQNTDAVHAFTRQRAMHQDLQNTPEFQRHRGVRPAILTFAFDGVWRDRIS